MNLTIVPEGMGAANTYIGYDPRTKEAFIIDPGRNDKTYENFLKENGLTLKKILLTHGHFDHMTGAEALRKATGASIYAAEAEKPALEDAKVNLTEMTGEGKTLKADHYLKDDETFEVLPGETFQVLLTPGHTPGSICFYDEKDGLLFSGDTVFQNSIGRTDFPGGSYSDIMKSLDRVLKLPASTVILPGHGEKTTVDFEKKYNPFL